MRSKPNRWIASALLTARSYGKSLSSPVVLAGGFAICATVSSVVAAYLEGRLTTVQHVSPVNGTVIAIIPFSHNLSTLVDFILINPSVIFFFQRSKLHRQKVDARLQINSQMPVYHRLGLAALCFFLGIFAMKFYVEGSRFFDATLVPGDDGQAKITITGWIVYSWTALYIAWLLFSAMEHGFHIARLMRLQASDIPYAPFHPDGAAGVRFLMEPSLSAAYAMIGLLATFIVFIIHDRLLYHIDSNRLLGFAVYIAVVLPLFGLPVCKLHQLMKARRDEYLFDAIERTFLFARNSDGPDNWSKLADYMTAVANADKYVKIVCAFPVWPIPIALAVPPIGSIVAAIFPLAQKLITSAAPPIPGL